MSMDTQDKNVGPYSPYCTNVSYQEMTYPTAGPLVRSLVMLSREWVSGLALFQLGFAYKPSEDLLKMTNSLHPKPSSPLNRSQELMH